MSGSAIRRDGYGRLVARRLSSWTRDHARKAAQAGLDCAVLGVSVVAQLRLGDDVALALTGGYEARSIGSVSDEFRKVLNAGISLTATGRSPGFVCPGPFGVSASLDGCSN